ncbi:MAG: hypothetical protein DRG78_16650 [Epsilonproteobacteria bacterium]|nr:MAG: hypothetical protein DRG78_16650 [Campylobacterota bacterium]
MKHIVFKEDDKKAIDKAIKEANKSLYKSKLLQIFTATTNEKKLGKLIERFSKKFPDAIIIGSTTAGEIANAKMYDDSTVISLSLFKTTTLNAKYIKNIDKNAGKKLSKKLCSKHTKASIILSEGLKGQNYEEFISGFQDENPNIIIAGGLAGDNFKLAKTLIFLGTKVYTKGSVAVSFTSKTLFTDNKYNLNWTPIGKEFIVSSSQGNIVHEIDGLSAVKLFKKYLGSEIFDNDAKALPDFQLLYKEGSTTVSRTPMARDGDSLIFAAPIKEGQKVQFGFSNAASVISGANTIRDELKAKPAEAIYVFSCIARKGLLGKKLEREFENFETIAPTVGFFTYGEYYSTNTNNALLNCTTTLLILSEKEQKRKRGLKRVKDTQLNMDDITFTALTHFIKQTSDELNSNVKLLNQYKTAVDSSLLVSKTDKEGVINYVNDNFCNVSKYTREELLGKNHNIVREKSVSSFIFKKMWKSIQSSKVWRGEFPNRAKDGSIYYVNATVMPTYNDEYEIDGYIAIRQDITKQIAAKNKMKEKEKLIKAIFDNQDSIVIFSSKSKGMINVNKTLFKYFDYISFEDFKTKHDCICELFIKEAGYIHPNLDKDWLEEVAEDEYQDHKAKMLIKDGSIHTFNIKVKKIDDEYIINLYDITNLEVALHKAYSSEQAKSMFLANMSHEIRTPLNGILGFTDILMKKDLEKESKKYVGIIHKSGQSLLSVVNDILDFSKLESGELSVEAVESNLFLEMESAVSTFASSAKSKQIDYFTYIDTNIPKTLLCDAQRVKQIINNLISNAIKFTPESGEVRVNIILESLEDAKAKILFSVKDSGIGIAKDKIATVFQAFSQADNSISRKFGGTGLGLSISSQYTKMMGDTLKVKSIEGEGSEFYFELELDVIATNEIENSFDVKDTSIRIFQPTTTISCGINEVLVDYLDSWKCHYEVIESLDELDDSIEILIVCAKLFDQNSCKNALSKFEKLQLIYIEGGDIRFECADEKFHLIEQPMTGSALFDEIITLTHSKNVSINPSKPSTYKSKQFSGNILIAEDNPTNQMLIEIMLQERGLSFTIVENGQEAIDEAFKNDYDLIFMDINMPVLDGVSATKILRQKEYTKSIVSLSANVIASDVESFKEAGVDASLNKPIVAKELDDILEKYIKKSKHESKQESKIKFDVIDIDSISNALSLPNKAIILKLLNSFSSSIQDIKQKLQNKNLDKDILHSLKGLSGNLRFNELYKLTQVYEEELSSWNESQNREKTELIQEHLTQAIKTIDLLNKQDI